MNATPVLEPSITRLYTVEHMNSGVSQGGSPTAFRMARAAMLLATCNRTSSRVRCFGGALAGMTTSSLLIRSGLLEWMADSADKTFLAI